MGKGNQKGTGEDEKQAKEENIQASNDCSKTLIISPLHHYYHQEQGLETVEIRSEGDWEKNSYLGRKALQALENEFRSSSLKNNGFRLVLLWLLFLILDC